MHQALLRQQMLLVKVHAPLWCKNRQGRETFFNSKVINLPHHLPQNDITGGDLNSVVSRDDYKVNGSRCEALLAFRPAQNYICNTGNKTAETLWKLNTELLPDNGVYKN
jgi:hypothetical protein